MSKENCISEHGNRLNHSVTAEFENVVAGKKPWICYAT